MSEGHSCTIWLRRRSRNERVFSIRFMWYYLTGRESGVFIFFGFFSYFGAVFLFFFPNFLCNLSDEFRVSFCSRFFLCVFFQLFYIKNITQALFCSIVSYYTRRGCVFKYGFATCTVGFFLVTPDFNHAAALRTLSFKWFGYHSFHTTGTSDFCHSNYHLFLIIAIIYYEPQY